MKEKSTVQKALEVLGKKNFALIIHGGSFPSAKDENTGFGTMNSNGAKSLIDYADGIFNCIQLGPAGKTKDCDCSPYTSTIFSTNPLFVDLKALTADKWGKILSEKTFKSIVECNPNSGKNKTVYSYVYKQYADALDEAYKNFSKKSLLKREFEEYKVENNKWLDKDSLYEALSIENGNDYWPIWKNEADKDLFAPESIEQRFQNGERLKEISEKYAYEIDKYKFVQFVLYVQNNETREYAQKHGIKMIADRQVAFSDRDIWAYKSLFLKGWLLGCPPDYFSKDGQAWGFPVLDPKKLFNSDGELDDGGKFLKRLYTKMFKENPGGVRIDHIVGLIDPWVYKDGKMPKVEQGAGRLYSSPENCELSDYAVANVNDLDNNVTPDNELRVKTISEEQIKLYGRLLEKIVIASAKEQGSDIDGIVCEDLGTVTNPVAAVMKNYGLYGMRLTQFVVPTDDNHPYRCKNIQPNSWIMTGTHDNEPIVRWANRMVHTHEGYLHVKNLVDDLYADEENKDDLIVKMTNDAEFLKETKFVELFASKAENVQIFFTDYFNIDEVYNKPGTAGDSNWSLRLPDNFKDLHPINLPKILKQAIISRGKDFAQKHKDLIEELSEL